MIFNGNMSTNCFANRKSEQIADRHFDKQPHQPKESMESEMLVHNGGCHCRSVRWRVQAPSSVLAWECNCSDCSMRGNTHFIVPSVRFELLGDSKQFLTTYTFGTHTAKHTFCKVCGITSFYTPRSNPDGKAVTFRCVDPGTLTHVEIKRFDGRNWENSYSATGIASCSKGLSEEGCQIGRSAD